MCAVLPCLEVREDSHLSFASPRGRVTYFIIKSSYQILKQRKHHYFLHNDANMEKKKNITTRIFLAVLSVNGYRGMKADNLYGTFVLIGRREKKNMKPFIMY